jgi:hypothetical protein
MIRHELRPEEGLLIVMPEGALQAEDFQNLAREIDPYIEKEGRLRGLMILTESFPGWDSFAALIAHLRFVKDHHRQIEKVAAVTDSNFLSIVPLLVRHFVQAEIRHFSYRDKEAALAWLTGA